MNINLKYISSARNPIVLQCKKLENAGERRKTGLFLIEGLRELQLAAKGGYRFQSLIFPDKIMEEKDIISYIIENQIFAENNYVLDHKIFAGISYRESIRNVVAIAFSRKLNLTDLILKPFPLFVILENIEKPGNLGALLRTCDAAGVDAVIITDNQTDIYNPNVVRSSIGTLFTNQVVLCEKSQLIDFLDQNKIKVFVTTPSAEKIYTESDFTVSSALVFGSESSGISPFWLKERFEKILIPMAGKADSLNVSVSAAIVLYEAVRQRKIARSHIIQVTENQ